MSLYIPYENFVGAVLGGRFQLQYLLHQEDNLDVYSVKSLGGLCFEAQAFSLSGLPAKLLQARKRRMKRIHQSRNFVCEIEQAGKRFLVLDVERSDAEWRNLTHKPDGHVSDSIYNDSCSEDFPDLTAHTNTLSFSRPPSSLNSVSRRSSYAEVASKGLEHDRSSKTGKGVKQRQKRQRKRKEAVLGALNHQAPSITMSRIKPQNVSNNSTLPSKNGEQDFSEGGSRTLLPESIGKTKKLRELSPIDGVSQSVSFQSNAEKEPMLSANATTIEQTSISMATQASSLPEHCGLKSFKTTTPEGNLKLPHFLISIVLDEDQTVNINACSEWFAVIFALAQYGRIHTVYHNSSTSLIASLPVVLWDLLQEKPACKFIGYVKSDDILTGVLDPKENMILVPKETSQCPRSSVPATSLSGRVKAQIQTCREFQRIC